MTDLNLIKINNYIHFQWPKYSSQKAEIIIQDKRET